MSHDTCQLSDVDFVEWWADFCMWWCWHQLSLETLVVIPPHSWTISLSQTLLLRSLEQLCVGRVIWFILISAMEASMIIDDWTIRSSEDSWGFVVVDQIGIHFVTSVNNYEQMPLNSGKFRGRYQDSQEGFGSIFNTRNCSNRLNWFDKSYDVLSMLCLEDPRWPSTTCTTLSRYKWWRHSVAPRDGKTAYGTGKNPMRSLSQLILGDLKAPSTHETTSISDSS